MNSSPAQGGRASSNWLVWMLSLLFVVYPLSIGPAARLHQAYRPARPVIETFYLPIVALAERVPFIERALEWYVKTIWGLK